MNPGIEAVRTLANMGYRFTVNGETIKAKYRGQGKPNPAQVRPLVDVMKATNWKWSISSSHTAPAVEGAALPPTMKGGPSAWPVIGWPWRNCTPI